MKDLYILNNAAGDLRGKSEYIDTYLFRPDQKPREGNMSKVYKGYRLSDIRIALQNGTLALPTSECRNMKLYDHPTLIIVPGKSKSANAKNLIREFEMVEKSGIIKPVAIKILLGKLAKIPMYRERFVRETRIRLDHPNVVKIIDYVLIPDKTNGKHHIVMEYLDGKTLEDMLLEDGMFFSEHEALDIVKQILEGLKAIHSQEGTVHRDIKSSNVMKCHDGVVKIIDFGIAKTDNDEVERKLTGIATFIGTLAYASPEQVRMLNVTPQTDLWSAGVLLYQLLSGKLPFEGLNDEERKRKILEEPTPALSGVSENVNKIIRKATQKEWKTRYKDAEEFIADIENISQKKTPVSRPVGAYISVAITLLIILLFYIIFKSKT